MDDDERQDLPYGEDFHDPAVAAQWADAAARKRPWRPRLFDRFAAETLSADAAAPRILELGSGPGFLAAAEYLAVLSAAGFLDAEVVWSARHMALYRARV